MKRIIYLMTAALVLTGCAGTAASEEKSSGSVSDVYEVQDIYAEDGTGIGLIGDTFHTKFFDFTVHSAVIDDSYDSYTAQSGNELIIINLDVTNNTSEEIEMYDYDFQIEWDDNDESVEFPITFYDAEVVNDMLPAVYTLAAGESKTGDLVFEVPDTVDETYLIDLCYVEYLIDQDGNESEGDLFFVILSYGDYAEDADTEAE